MSELEQIVELKTARLAVRLDGDPDRPWMIVSNGLASNYEIWNAQVPMLTKTHRVLRYNTRGHGRSSAPPGPYGFPDLVGDVVALMDHFGIGRADVLGLSMGGMTALGLAIHHPARIRRIVCCDARADAAPGFVAGWDGRIAAVHAAGGIEGIVSAAVERWFTSCFRQQRPDMVRLAADVILTTSPEGYVACAEALKRLDYRGSLGAIGCPVLYVCGSQDEATPPATMREMADLTPGSAYAEVDPGAHLPNLENPDAFNRIVREWLKAPPRGFEPA